MSHQDAKRTSDADSPSRRLTRRSLLQGAATAGAAGLAVTAMGAAASPALAATSRSSAPEQPAPEQSASVQSQDHHEHAGPIMVHVRDARTGDIEVFSGTSQTQLRDKDLAARIARALA
ncbi:MAG TPA: hypothetical protein VGI00_00125 [Streptosporangiaceae bacterium]